MELWMLLQMTPSQQNSIPIYLLMTLKFQEVANFAELNRTRLKTSKFAKNVTFSFMFSVIIELQVKISYHMDLTIISNAWSVELEKS